MRVFVLNKNKEPMMPCHPARARILLKSGRAKVYRRYPFTIIVTDREEFEAQQVELKIDLGSKTTGLAIVAKFDRGHEVLWAANLDHRGQQVMQRLEKRRQVRRSRRNRKTRYRPPRFSNRARPKGWLPPSLQSRGGNITVWATRLIGLAPVTSIEIETSKFDTQLMANPEISGIEYQQGELQGYEVREYLLEKFARTCVYCGAEDVPLQVEHLTPVARGGSNRVSNLGLACEPCNREPDEEVKARVWLGSIIEQFVAAG